MECATQTHGFAFGLGFPVAEEIADSDADHEADESMQAGLAAKAELHHVRIVSM